MRRPMIDTTDPVAASRELLQHEQAANDARSQARSALLTFLPAGMLGHLDAFGEACEARGYAFGRRDGLHFPVPEANKKIEDQRAQITGLLAKLEEARRRAPVLPPDLREQIARAQRAEQEVERLRAENKRLHERLGPAARAQRLQVARAAKWSHPAGKVRVARRDEAPTEAPTEVARIARRVEEFVRKAGGKCSKSDVRAAMPTEPHLSEVYRHLHNARRIRVTGMTLEVWR